MARTIRTCKTASLKGTATATLVGALLGALAVGTPAQAFDSSSRYGSYLAGRYAVQNRDISSAAYYFQKALIGDPQNEGLLQQSFFLALSDGRINQAVDHAYQLVQLNNDYAVARIVLAVSEMGFREPARAQNHLELADESGLILPIFKAWTLAAQGKTDDAIAMIDKMPDDTGYGGFKTFHAALIYQQAGRTEDADARYRQAMQQAHAASNRVIQSYGRFLERAGRQAEAQTLYQGYLAQSPQKMIQMDLARVMTNNDGTGEIPEDLIQTPQDGIAELLFGISALLTQGKSKESAPRYLQLALHLEPDFEEAHILLAEEYENDERWDLANQHYAKVPLSSPLSLNVRVRRALNQANMGQTGKAIEQLEEILEIHPDDQDVLLSIADLLRSEKKYSESVPFYDRAMDNIEELNRNDWALLYTRGVVLEQSQQWERAEQDFLKALELHPEQPLVLNYLGYSWVEQKRNLDKARKMIERAVELRPRDGYIVDSLGWVLYRLGDYDTAVSYLEKAVLLRPEDSTINDHLGDAYWHVGRKREARFQWSHALASDPDEKLEAEIKAKLENGLASVPVE